MDFYQWQGTHGEKIAVLITEGGHFACIVEIPSAILYVANVSCHPIVLTNEIIFLNSDGSTFMDFPKELLTQSGAVVADFIIKTAEKFIKEQQH